MRNPEEFYEFYKTKMIYEDAKPNYGHIFMKEVEDLGKNVTVVTQNIDGLHQSAGSKNVLELHGSVLRNNCMKCGKFYDLKDIMMKKDVPMCECGGTTPRQLTDLLGSLSDLTSGSGDKGTPIILIKGYFDNYANN